ncbi:MAG: hypothetical protein E7345_00095 [Clostridiales bacterium]|nr:hypothetical protein [Clostridiales bacterium]
MPSTFRLIKAEFKKIFKRPSVFIVALLIVATILGSAYLFNPTKRNNYNISYTNVTTSQDFYNTYYYSDLEDSQSHINELYDDTDKIINYYSLYYKRISDLDQYYGIVSNKINNLKNEKDDALKVKKLDEFRSSLQDFKVKFETFGSLAYNYSFVLFTNDNEKYISSCSAVNDLIDACNNSSYTPNDIVNIYNTNDYESKLKNELEYGKYFISKTLDILTQNIKDDYNAFQKEITINGSSHINSILSSKKTLLDDTIILKNYFEEITEFNTPIVLISKDDHKTYSNLFETCIGELEKSTDYNSLRELSTTLTYENFSNLINTLPGKITQVMINSDFNTSFSNINKVVIENRKNIDDKISLSRNENSIKNISFFATEYKLLANAYNSYILDNIILDIINDYESATYLNFYNYGFDSINVYNLKENLAKNLYYIENNIYSNSFLNNFAFNQNSSELTNTYDYMYFSLEFCAIIIMIFAVMMISNIITGEMESGTIKLLLVRPYKRSKIITAKLLATIFFVVIFMLFSSILSFVVGYFQYDLVEAEILAVFNGNTAFTINPLLLMGINILSLIIDIIFFVIVALMFSILFKNYAGAITTSLVIIISTFALNAIFPTAFWYSFFPAMNLHLFKYFGNSFISIESDNIIKNALITPIQNTMAFPFSILLLISYSVIMLIVSYSVFKKRDF